MTWPFENDTAAIINKLVKRNMHSEKRRNLMVVAAVALAAFLISFTGTMGVSMSQILKNKVTDTWEVVFTETTEENTAALHNIREFARVGEYYMAGAEPDAKGYTLSFVYSDSETLYMFRDQMRLQEGRLPESANEIAVSDYFLSQFAPMCILPITMIGTRIPCFPSAARLQTITGFPSRERIPNISALTKGSNSIPYR